MHNSCSRESTKRKYTKNQMIIQFQLTKIKELFSPQIKSDLIDLITQIRLVKVSRGDVRIRGFWPF